MNFNIVFLMRTSFLFWPPLLKHSMSTWFVSATNVCFRYLSNSYAPYLAFDVTSSRI
jgi:hypothetical protein